MSDLPRYDLTVHHIKDNETVTTLYNIDINYVMDRVNYFLPDIPLEEKYNFSSYLQDRGHYVKRGKTYQLIAQLARENNMAAITPDLTPTHDYKEAIEELTEALRLTAVQVGEERLPALEGVAWFDALTKYAPDKAAEFVPKNPVENLFPYQVYIQVETFLPHLNYVDAEGASSVLMCFTTLTSSEEIEKAIDKLREEGRYSRHSRGKEEPNTVHIVDRKKYRIDDRGMLTRLNRLGQPISPAHN